MPRPRSLLAPVAAVVLALALGLATPTTTATRAQEAVGWSGWIALQVWDCPSGMTAETLDPWSCALSTGEYDVSIGDGDWNPLLGLGDAYFDGWTFTWQGLPVGTPWAPIPYRIVQSSPPAGSAGWVVRYAMDEGPGETVWFSDASFGADLHVYNFFP